MPDLGETLEVVEDQRDLIPGMASAVGARGGLRLRRVGVTETGGSTGSKWMQIAVQAYEIAVLGDQHPAAGERTLQQLGIGDAEEPCLGCRAHIDASMS